MSSLRTHKEEIKALKELYKNKLRRAKKRQVMDINQQYAQELAALLQRHEEQSHPGPRSSAPVSIPASARPSSSSVSCSPRSPDTICSSPPIPANLAILPQRFVTPPGSTTASAKSRIRKQQRKEADRLALSRIADATPQRSILRTTPVDNTAGDDDHDGAALPLPPELLVPLARLQRNDASLTRLALAGYVGDRGALAVAARLRHNDALTELELPATAVSLVGVQALCEALASNSTLRRLDLSHNPVGDRGADAVAACLRSNAGLRALLLDSARLSARGGGALLAALAAGNASLTQLSLRGCPLDASVWPAVSAAAQAANARMSLRQLSLAGVQLDASGVQAVGDVVHACLQLERLAITSSSLDDEQCAGALFAPLGRHAALRVLDLTDTRLGAGAGAAVAGALRCSSALVELRLSGCLLGRSVGDVLAALAGNRTVAVVELSGGALGSAGAQLLAAVVEQNTVLRSLTLAHCAITDDDVELVADALPANSTLTHLGLAGNALTSSGVDTIAAALEHNYSLLSVALHGQTSPVAYHHRRQPPPPDTRRVAAQLRRNGYNHKQKTRSLLDCLLRALVQPRQTRLTWSIE